MTTLDVFRTAFTETLQTAIRTNIDRYAEEEPWVIEIPAFSSKQLHSAVALNDTIELLFPEEGDLRDVENAMRIHRALHHLTRLQARDPRLWTRLAHVELWTYMRRRWPVERFEDIDKRVRLVESRYFVTQSQSRALLRHGVARLWWAAALSYDGNRQNPYELTSVLFSTLDITQQILERGLGRAPVIVKSFLQFLLRNDQLLLRGGDSARTIIRELAKHLNLYGGVCILDALSEAEIIAVLDTELNRLLVHETADST